MLYYEEHTSTTYYLLPYCLNSMARSSWNNDANMLLLQSNDKSFLDNPMYPISVTAEETTIIITLYQNDRRWSVARTG